MNNRNRLPMVKLRDFLNRHLPLHKATAWITNKRWNNKIITLGKQKKHKCSFVIKGKNNTIVIKNNCQMINTSLYIYGNNNTIEIGKNCRLNKVILYIDDSQNKITIGNNCSFGETFLASGQHTELRIGNDCMFSSGISIVTNDSHKILNSKNKIINEGKNVIIGNHVWVCKNVNILKNGSVGNGCIIGSNSLVTKDFSSTQNAIICGHPAYVIRTDVTWEK